MEKLRKDPIRLGKAYINVGVVLGCLKREEVSKYIIKGINLLEGSSSSSKQTLAPNILDDLALAYYVLGEDRIRDLDLTKAL